MRTLRALHRLIEARMQDFSARLVDARRNSEQLEELLACTADLGVLLDCGPALQEQLLFPALELWAGGRASRSSAPGASTRRCARTSRCSTRRSSG